MATIKRNVDITYTARGLEEIAAEAKKISLFPVDSTNIDQLQSRIASLRGILAGYPDLLVSPEMAAEFGKEYENIIKMLGKARTDLIATQNEQAAGELQKLQAEIDLIDQNIQEKQDEIEKISKRVKLDPETQLYGTEVKSYRKEVLQQATSALDPEDQMKGITGREIKNADSFVAAMEKVDEVFKNIDVTKQAIFKKMQDGEALTVAELAVLQEQLGKQEAVKLSAQEIAQQYIIRKKILEEEQNIYKKTDGLMKKTREDEIKYLEETKGKFVELKSQIESDVEEGSFLSGKDAEKLKVLNSSLELSSKLSAEYKNKVKDLKEAQKENEAATKDATKATDKQGSTLGKAAKQVFSYGLAFSALRRIYRETIRTITDLDKALTEMAIVTSMNRKEAWNLVGTFQDLAKQTGFTTTEIAKLSTVYFRQGRSLSDVIELTKVAAQAARIAGISAAESANFLTSAVNGFGLAADKALSVSDKFAALAASSASSYEELANGLSKFASQANIAGISIDFAMGMLAKGVETTREAPETIGTAIKTVLARMRELTDLGKTFEDGMDINRVEVALRQVGVQLRDSSGQFRDMEKVLTEIGMKWETLNTNQRASIAVSLAGTRQQSRLIAIMSNFDRTLELVNTSQESAGATTAQQVEYMKSMQAALVGLQTAYQKFITTITDSELVISIVKILSGAIEGIANILDSFGIAGKNAMIALFGLAAAVKLNSTFTKIYNGQLWKNLGLTKASTIADTIKALAQNALTVGVKGTTKALLAQAAAFAVTPYGLVLVAVIALAGAFALFTQGIEDSNNGVNSFAAGFAQIALMIGKTLQGVWLELVIAFKDLERGIERVAQKFKFLEPVFKFLFGWANVDSMKAVNEQLEKELNQRKLQVYTYEELAKAQETVQRNNEAENYELQQKNKTIKKLSDEYERLNRIQTLGIVSDKEREELAKLESDLKAFGGGKFLEFSNGQIDLGKTIEGLGKISESNQQEIANNLRDTAEKSLLLAQKDFNQFMNDDKNIGSVLNYLVFGQAQAKDVQLTDDQRTALRKFYTEVITEAGQVNLSELEQLSITDTLLDAITKYESDLQANTAGFEGQIKSYKDALNTLTDPSAIRAFRETYSMMSGLIDIFGESAGQYGKVFEDLSLTQESFNTLTIKAKEAGIDIKDLIVDIKNRYDELEDIPESLRMSYAFTEVARTIEDAELSTVVFNLAFKKNIQEIGQEVDTVNSKIRRLSEMQDKFLKGDVTDTELFDFLQDYNEFLPDPKFVEDFLKGRDLSIYLLKQETKAQDEYRKTLFQVSAQLDDYLNGVREWNQSQVDSLLAQKTSLELLMAYKGELANITKEQYLYNKSLQAYKNITDMGMISLELQLKMIQRLKDLGLKTLVDIDKEIADISNKLATAGIDDTIVKIIDGVVILQDGFYDLDATQKKFVEGLANSLQSQLDAVRNYYKTLMDETIKAEEDLANEKIKIYENYFASLDRLEAVRQRKIEREDLVAQLRRLEGATDERSRRKALEIRKQLNQLDVDTAKQEREESRKSLIDSISEGVEKIRATFQEIWIKFLETGSAAGANMGNALIEILRDYGLLPNTTTATPTAPTTTTTPTVPSAPTTSASSGGSGATRIGNNLIPDFNVLDRFGPTLMPYAKGGLVDYTGLAMMHGSKKDPEAVLNPQQTQMFMQLSDSLTKMAFEGKEGLNGVNIEKIEIKTDSLNNNQDFARAGQELANAFSSAIQRRGITVNTKR